jgi:hypothetical protein
VGLTAEEAIPIGQDFQRARATDDFTALDLAANDTNDELSAAHPRVFVNAFLFRQLEKCRHGHSIKVIEPAGTRTSRALDPFRTFIEWAIGTVCPFGSLNPVDAFDGWSRHWCRGDRRCGGRWSRESRG